MTTTAIPILNQAEASRYHPGYLWRTPVNPQQQPSPDSGRDNPLAPEHQRHTSAAIQALTGLALFAAVATGFGLLTALLLMTLHPDSTTPVRVLALTGSLVLGLGVCGLFIVGITLIRRLDRLSEQTAGIEQQTAIRAQQSAATAPVQAREEPAIAELRDQLAGIQETLLLPDNLRRERFEALKEREHAARLAAAEKLANSNDFHRAREQLRILTQRFGTSERVVALETQIEKQAQAAQEMDVRHARDRIKDLMALNQWDQAEQLTREISEKYPQSPEPLGLFQHVCRERQLFEQRHRTRLYEEIQQFATQRHWQDAAQAARQFITTFPTGQDTEAVRARLETLEANAEIQTRQQMENRIKEHVRQHEYWEALALARKIITDYPFSPQANALRAQVPRLEELARNPKA